METLEIIARSVALYIEANYPYGASTHRNGVACDANGDTKFGPRVIVRYKDDLIANIVFADKIYLSYGVLTCNDWPYHLTATYEEPDLLSVIDEKLKAIYD